MTTIAETANKLGYREYALIPNDGKRHEIIDGVHFVIAAPNLYHQAVSKRLQYLLYTKVELADLGTMFNAPCDVQLSDHDIVQPDLLVVLKARTRIFTPTNVKGAPDLIVEILSPSSEDYDRSTKRELYRKRSVQEYWIVDPSEQSVEQLVLRTDQYLSKIETVEITCEIIPGLSINLRDVW